MSSADKMTTATNESSFTLMHPAFQSTPSSPSTKHNSDNNRTNQPSSLTYAAEHHQHASESCENRTDLKNGIIRSDFNTEESNSCDSDSEEIDLTSNIGNNGCIDFSNNNKC